jgi:transposase
MCFKGTCNTELFNAWIEQFLVPELKPGQVVVMDNAALNKSPRTRELIESARCHLIFPPSYSPALNPIEIFWANLKAKIKSIIANFNNLSDSIYYAFNAYYST